MKIKFEILAIILAFVAPGFLGLGLIFILPGFSGPGMQDAGASSWITTVFQWFPIICIFGGMPFLVYGAYRFPNVKRLKLITAYFILAIAQTYILKMLFSTLLTVYADR